MLPWPAAGARRGAARARSGSARVSQAIGGLAAWLLAAIGLPLALAAGHRWLSFGSETDYLGLFMPEAKRLLAGQPLQIAFHPPLYPCLIALAWSVLGDWVASRHRGVRAGGLGDRAHHLVAGRPAVRAPGRARRAGRPGDLDAVPRTGRGSRLGPRLPGALPRRLGGSSGGRRPRSRRDLARARAADRAGAADPDQRPAVAAPAPGPVPGSGRRGPPGTGALRSHWPLWPCRSASGSCSPWRPAARPGRPAITSTSP